jgi:hypothetical protein
MIRKFNIRIIAFSLLLVFTPKLGLRVWMHHWFHETKNVQNLPVTGTSSSSLQIKCDCAEDALMPLTEAQVFHLPACLDTFTGFIHDDYHSSIFTAVKHFPSLKGPPPVNSLS